jgi:hypothetical protein
MNSNQESRLSRRRLLTGTAGAVGAAAVLPGVAAAAPPGPAPAFGPVRVGPDDPRYPDLIHGVDQRWVGRPESVRVVAATEHVVAVVQEAVRTGKRLTVRSGGHCYEDFVFNPEVQIVLDMAGLNSVHYDAGRHAFAVEAGATLLNVHERLYKGWGVVLPAGICYSVGAGGHVCGGGWGLLCRRNGLVVDHLEAIEVVVVDAAGRARAVVASRDPADPNHDLWWAHTGGGGGTFGVVTRYWFRSPDAHGTDPGDALPKPPGEMLLSAIAWPWEKLTEATFAALVRNYGAWHVANAAPGGPYDGLCSFLNLNHRSNGEVVLLTAMDATVPGAERLLADYLAGIRRGVDISHGPATQPSGEHGPLTEFLVPQRWGWLKTSRYLGTGHQRITNPTLRGDYKSAYHKRNFTDAQLRTMYRQLSSDDLDNPVAVAQLSSYGGQVNAVGRTSTAQVHRDSSFKVIYQTHWSEPADDAVNVAWLRGFYEALYAGTGGVPVPGEATDGCYVNYCDADLNDPAHNRSGVAWHTLYWVENYARLQRVKARWDPRNFFRHRQSVRLP